MSRGTLVPLELLAISPTRLSRSLDGFPKTIRLSLEVSRCGPQPRCACTPVWAPPRSLAATWGIDFSFSSSGYLDVSVHRLTFQTLWIHAWMHEVCSCGLPHSEIPGSVDICSSPGLFAAYHVLHRLSVPRHPPCALSAYSCSFPFRASVRYSGRFSSAPSPAKWGTRPPQPRACTFPVPCGCGLVFRCLS